MPCLITSIAINNNSARQGHLLRAPIVRRGQTLTWRPASGQVVLFALIGADYFVNVINTVYPAGASAHICEQRLGSVCVVQRRQQQHEPLVVACGAFAMS